MLWYTCCSCPPPRGRSAIISDKPQWRQVDGKISPTPAAPVENRDFLSQEKKIMKNESTENPIKTQQIVIQCHSSRSHQEERNLPRIGLQPLPTLLPPPPKVIPLFFFCLLFIALFCSILYFLGSRHFETWLSICAFFAWGYFKCTQTPEPLW